MRTESAAAPAASSSRASSATGKSARIRPLEGEAFFSSAMTASRAVVVSQFQAEATRLAGGGLDHERIAGCRSLGSGDALAAGSNDFVQAAGHGVEKV